MTEQEKLKSQIELLELQIKVLELQAKIKNMTPINPYYYSQLGQFQSVPYNNTLTSGYAQINSLSNCQSQAPQINNSGKCASGHLYQSQAGISYQSQIAGISNIQSGSTSAHG